MESVSSHFERMTTPDDGPPTSVVKCSCGRPIEPVWMLTRWHFPNSCKKCREEEWRHLEQQREHEALVRRVGEHKLGMTFEEFEPYTESQKKALDVIEAKRSAWLWGRPGVGKTHLAVAACIEEEDSQYVLVADLMAQLRQAAQDGEDERIVQRLRRIGLLVLDDLGVERPTPYVLEQLYRIVDYRADAKAWTIVTSNASPSDLAAVLGARIHSRLVGMCHVVHIEAPDRRLM